MPKDPRFPVLVRCPRCSLLVMQATGQDEPPHLVVCRACRLVYTWRVSNSMVQMTHPVEPAAIVDNPVNRV